MKRFLASLVRTTFEMGSLEDALLERIGDLIDYEAIADQIVEDYEADIHEMIQEIIEEST